MCELRDDICCKEKHSQFNLLIQSIIIMITACRPVIKVVNDLSEHMPAWHVYWTDMSLVLTLSTPIGVHSPYSGHLGGHAPSWRHGHTTVKVCHIWQTEHHREAWPWACSTQDLHDTQRSPGALHGPWWDWVLGAGQAVSEESQEASEAQICRVQQEDREHPQTGTVSPAVWRRGLSIMIWKTITLFLTFLC